MFAAPKAGFISCAPVRADQDRLERLLTHLAPLKSTLEVWHRRCVRAGEDPCVEVTARMAAAQVFLLLVSADYLACEACCVEAEKAVARHEADEALVIPIIVRPCHWIRAPWARFAVSPRHGRPVSSSPDPEMAWSEVVRAIESAVMDAHLEDHLRSAHVLSEVRPPNGGST